MTTVLTYWIVFPTGKTTGAKIIKVPNPSTEYTNIFQGLPVTVSGVSYTSATTGGPFSTLASAKTALVRITKSAGGPVPSTVVTQAWFVVPEGSVGEIVNTLSVEGDTLNPAQLSKITSLSSFLSVVGNEGSNLTKIFADATGKGNTTYTVLHATTPVQIYALEAQGLKPYKTQTEAQTVANQQSQTSGTSWEQSLQNFFSALGSANLWIRVTKIAFGGTLLIVGLVKITGADKTVGGVAAKAVKIAPLL
jgi:hypothetical protein